MTDEDAQTIVALLTNLVERIEGVEKKQETLATADQLSAFLEFDAKRWEAVNQSLRTLKTVFEKESERQTEIAASIKALPKTAHDPEAAYRHGELNDWTKDLSTKLSILQSTVEQAVEKKRGLFG